MRGSMLACLLLGCAAVVFGGCGDPPIGQPCNFSWPKDSSGSANCDTFPACRPLQDGSKSVGDAPRNDACPIDCIQIPALECENLICVATQIEGDAEHMNGRCGTDIKLAECPGSPFGCMGYCTKDCLTSAGCPKGYSCSAMAPFETTLNCDDEEQWGTNCTSTCLHEGVSVGAGMTCPTSSDPDRETLCRQSDYSKCCTCICHQFCPVLNKKFCRKAKWDDDMFEDATTTATGCGSGSG